MPEFSRFAPYTLPDILDRIFWWGIRLGAVTFLFSVVGVAFFAFYNNGLMTWGLIIGFFMWIGSWLARYLLLRFWA